MNKGDSGNAPCKTGAAVRNAAQACSFLPPKQLRTGWDAVTKKLGWALLTIFPDLRPHMQDPWLSGPVPRCFFFVFFPRRKGSNHAPKPPGIKRNKYPNSHPSLNAYSPDTKIISNAQAHPNISVLHSRPATISRFFLDRGPPWMSSNHKENPTTEKSVFYGTLLSSSSGTTGRPAVPQGHGPLPARAKHMLTQATTCWFDRQKGMTPN